jgi:dTDP-4-amino-4,6-dideoxygalactose transaminase
MESIRAELTREIDLVLEKGWFVLGEMLERFENDFAKYCGVNHAVGVGSGTDALLLSLKSLGIGLGDEVLLPDNSFIATAEAVTHSGATPVFVDVDPRTYNIDVESVEVTKKTKAVIPVHLYGQPADMDGVKDFAERNGLAIIEDASQAHGAIYKGRKVGSLGDVGCFSFFPTKPLGAIGDAGMVTTDDEEVACKVRELRNHGRKELNVHVEPGYTSRLDEIQAAVLSLKLKHLDGWNARRRRIAKEYDELLGGLPEISTPYCLPETEHVYYLYVVRTRRRDELKTWLMKQGIETSIHYPTPIHLQPAYKDWGSCRVTCAEQTAKEILSLPIFAELKDEEVRYICEAIAKWMRSE